MSLESSDRYDVSRQFAAEILNVSLRTLDRYAKGNKISSVRRGRQLYFSEQELLSMKAEQIAAESILRKSVDMERGAREKLIREKVFSTRSWGKDGDAFIDVEVAQQKESDSVVPMVAPDYSDPMVDLVEQMISGDSLEARWYKQMSDSLQMELRDVKGQLKRAHVLVGELRTQQQRMIPQLEYKKQSEEILRLTEGAKRIERKLILVKSKGHLTKKRFEREVSSLTEQAAKQKSEMRQLKQQVELEKVARLVYGVLLFFVSATVPLALLVKIFG